MSRLPVQIHSPRWRRCLGWLPLLTLPFLLLRGAAADQATRLGPDFGADREGWSSFGTVRIQPASRSLLATGWVNQVSDAIEYLACGPGGKTHESVLVLAADVKDIHAGLLLLGLKPGHLPTGARVGPPIGPMLELWVKWQDGGTTRVVRAERLVHNLWSGQTLEETDWCFTGSRFEDGQYMAAADESMVATYWDPWAIVNLPLPVGADDEALTVNEEVIPRMGTPVAVLFRAGTAPLRQRSESDDEAAGGAGN